MPRLGELLVAAGVVVPFQVEEALRAQVIHGARLGTNLIELGYLELDDIATALARQHRAPPALRRHFERCNPSIQQRLPAAIAARHAVIPIGHLSGDHSRILVAARGPLAPAARVEIEQALGLAPGAMVLAVAAELRVLYYLERVYGVPRANRFLRVRRITPESGTPAIAEPPPVAAPAPRTDEVTASRPRTATPFVPPDEFHIEETPVEHLLDPPDPGTSWRRPRPPEPAPDEMVPAPVAEPLPMGGQELRRFVETLDAPTIGRIPIRSVAFRSASNEITEAAEIAALLRPEATLDELARAIRRAHSRERVGELAIGALRRFGDGLDAALLFVVREAVAIGWKGFSNGVEDLAVDSLAVPLDAPTILGDAVREKRALLLDREQGSPIDQRLWAALGCPTPGQVAAAPIAIADHPVAILYGQSASDRGMAPLAELFATIQQATLSAFARMLRAAQR